MILQTFYDKLCFIPIFEADPINNQDAILKADPIKNQDSILKATLINNHDVILPDLSIRKEIAWGLLRFL